MLYDPKWTPPAEIKLEPWQQLLLDAAEILEQRGWVQNIFHSTGGFCMYGAMVETYGDLLGLLVSLDRMPKPFRTAAEKLNQTLRADLGLSSLDGFQFWDWNDEPGRTKETVIAKLREVAHAV